MTSMVNVLRERILIMKSISALNRILLNVFISLICVVAVVFPYPFLANFVFESIWDYVFRIWAATLAIGDTTNLRIALTPLILVAVGLFFSLHKLTTTVDDRVFTFLKHISTVIKWYCIIATMAVMSIMWFGLTIGADRHGIVVSFGDILFGWASGQSGY